MASATRRIEVMKSALVVVALLIASCVATEETSSTSSIAESSSYERELAALDIEAECESPDYDRSDWSHWSQADEYADDWHDVRHLVLARDSKIEPDVEDQRVQSGKWRSPYDAKESTNPRDIDIDHVVPLSEAHESGACDWSADQRKRYANDAAGLLAVSSSSNRSKGGGDPADWLPAEDDYICEYLIDWLAIKQRWQLSIDQVEHDELASHDC